MAIHERSAEIDLTAAEWAVRVDQVPLEPENQRALDAWLAGDARRLGAFARARAVLLHARRLKALGSGFDPDAYLAQAQANVPAKADAVEFGETKVEPYGARSGECPSGAGRPMHRRTLLVAATGALAASAIGVVAFNWPYVAQTYATRRGEIRLVPLADGSTLTLNTASIVKVNFSDRERHIALIAGEVLFDIVDDALVPLVVSSSQAVVRTSGSSFTVGHLAGRAMQVVVRHGLVEIAAAAAAGRHDIRVPADSRAVIGRDDGITVLPMSGQEIARALAWREGMLSFEDMSLRDAAREFARYNDTRIVFDPPGVGDATLTGLFSFNDPMGFARAAALSLGLRVRGDRSLVTISSR